MKTKSGRIRCVWEDTAPAAPKTEVLHGEEICDVAVIGAGWTGLRTALDLANAGVSVVVVEKETIGYGASGRSGGQVNLGFKVDPDRLVSLEGHETGERMLKAVANVGNEVFNLIRENNLDCDANQKGWLKVSHCNSARRRQEAQLLQWRKHGVELDWLNGPQVEAQSGAEGYKSGLLYRQGGSVQPLAYTRELARVSQAKGARIFERSPVRSILSQTGTIKLSTPKGTIRAQKVVICTNGYSNGLWPGLAKSYIPIRSIQAATEPLPEQIRRHILPEGNTLSDMRNIIFYFRWERNNRLCFGGLGPFRDNYIHSDFDHLISGAERVFPSLRKVRWDYLWGGRLAMTHDSLPHIHELSPGIYAGLGFNGRGVGLGTIMGRNLADMVLGKPQNELDFPVRPLSKYPFHDYSRIGFPFVTKWMAIKDAFNTKFR